MSSKYSSAGEDSQTSTFETFSRGTLNKPVHWGRFRASGGGQNVAYVLVCEERPSEMSQMYWFAKSGLPKRRVCTGLRKLAVHDVADVLVCEREPPGLRKLAVRDVANVLVCRREAPGGGSDFPARRLAVARRSLSVHPVAYTHRRLLRPRPCPGIPSPAFHRACFARVRVHPRNVGAAIGFCAIREDTRAPMLETPGGNSYFRLYARHSSPPFAEANLAQETVRVGLESSGEHDVLCLVSRIV